MTTTTLTTPMDLAALGALLARYPMEWWVAGMVASALVGALALVGLRTAQHHSPPLRRFLPAQAYGVVLAAMGASAFALVLAGATMAELAESWSEGGRWGTLDDAIAQGLRTHADTAVLQWFAVLTHLGDSWVLTGCTVKLCAAKESISNTECYYYSSSAVCTTGVLNERTFNETGPELWHAP